MEELDDLIDTARDRAGHFLNADDRNWQHVAIGGLLAVGFTLAITSLAKEVPPRRSSRGLAHHVKTEVKAGNLLLPAIFSTNTLSAVRVWNAPDCKRRSTAMGLWALAQTANIWWLTARPQKLWGQIGAAMASAGLAAAFAYEAKRLNINAPVDPASQGQSIASRT